MANVASNQLKVLLEKTNMGQKNGRLFMELLRLFCISFGGVEQLTPDIIDHISELFSLILSFQTE